MNVKVWQFVSIFLWALVAGVFWGPWLGLSRSISSFSPEAFLAIGKTMIGNLAPVMPFLMIAAMASMLPVLIIFYRQRSDMFMLTLVSFALVITALMITLLVEVPIDNQIKMWTVNSLPGDWRQIRDRWETFHVLRTSASVGGLALMLAAALFSRRLPDESPGVIAMTKKLAMSEFRYRSAAATDLTATRDSHSGGGGRGPRSRPPARAPRHSRCRDCRRS